MGAHGPATSREDDGREVTGTTNDTTTGPSSGTVVKTRKPYTITKKRERWTEDEHAMFVESLKKFGRAWKKIEERIGTKSAVQIRSHAQKFFAKLQKEQMAASASEGSGDTRKGRGDGSTSQSKRTKGSYTSDLDLEIPPARPKRKPMHPYPKKATSQQTSGGSGGGERSGGTGKSSGTAQKWPAEATPELVSNAASTAAMAAVFSVASEKWQNTLHTELRKGYFGVPLGVHGLFPQAGMFPMQPMMGPFMALNSVGGAPSAPQMTNPQQFFNYANLFSNYWPQFPNAANQLSAMNHGFTSQPAKPSGNGE